MTENTVISLLATALILTFVVSLVLLLSTNQVGWVVPLGVSYWILRRAG